MFFKGLSRLTKKQLSTGLHMSPFPDQGTNQALPGYRSHVPSIRDKQISDLKHFASGLLVTENSDRVMQAALGCVSCERSLRPGYGEQVAKRRQEKMGP